MHNIYIISYTVYINISHGCDIIIARSLSIVHRFVIWHINLQNGRRQTAAETGSFLHKLWAVTSQPLDIEYEA